MPTSSAHAGKAGTKSKAKSPAPKTAPAKAAASSGPSPAVMPTYARQNVVFERGEGAWLDRHDGERYLDFGSGVAVNALGHAHPKLVAALTEQAQKLWHCVQSLPRRRPGAAGRAAVRGDLRRQGVLLQFRRRGLRRRHQAGAALSLRQRPSRALAHHHLQGRLPRPHAGDHRRRRQREVPRRLRPAGARLRPRPVRRSRRGRERPSAPRRPPSWSSRSRARAACASVPTSS